MKNSIKEMIYKGLKEGFIKLINNSLDDKVVCLIGDYWFYFIDAEHDSLTASEVYDFMEEEQLTDLIYQALREMQEDNFDRYSYFKSFLEKKCKEYHIDDCHINPLWNALKRHRGHKVEIVSYGDWDDPVDICLECEDCGEVIIDAELYSE